MSTRKAIESDDRRFGRAARRLGIGSIVVRAVAISFLLFFLVSSKGHDNRHLFGALPSVMGIDVLAYAGLFAGFPLAFLLSLAGLFKANSGRIVGGTYTEARKWSNLLMLLIGLDAAVLISAGVLALLPKKAATPLGFPRGEAARRRPGQRTFEQGAAKVDPKSRLEMEKNPSGEPSIPEKIRGMIDALDAPKEKGRVSEPVCVVSLRDGTRREGVLVTPSIGITTASGQVEISRDRLLNIRFGDLVRGEKTEALSLDGVFKGWADIADIDLKTADGALSLPRSRVKEIEVVSRRTPAQLLSLYGRAGVALAYANAVEMGREKLAKKLMGLLEKGRGAGEDRSRTTGRYGFPAEVGIARLDKKSDLLAFGDDKGRIHVFLSLSGELIPIARHDIDGVLFRNRPAILGAKLYIGGQSLSGSEGGLYSIDLLTGKRLWKANIGNIRYANVAVYRDLLFVTSGGTGGTGKPGGEPSHGDAGLYAVRIDTGRVEWFVPLRGAEGDRSPVVENGAVLLATSSQGANGAPPKVLRFRAEDGAPMEPADAAAEDQKAR